MAQDSQTTNYLFDFVYLNRDKLASYSAQLYDHGTLLSVKSLDGYDEQVTSKMEGGLAKVFRAEEAESGTNKRSMERQFDAAWSLPLNVINGLDERGLINRDINSASIGQMVLFRGRLQLVDLMLVKDLWAPIIAMMNGAAGKGKTAHQKQAAMAEKREMENLALILSKLPHTLQMRMFNSEANVWATLDHESMIINPVDFAMKHGSCIDGEWIVLGVLDAHPDNPELGYEFPEPMSELESGMLQMLLGLRTTFGRQPTDFGMTPIAVFRTIHPA